jgi:hypothetical protein
MRKYLFIIAISAMFVISNFAVKANLPGSGGGIGGGFFDPGCCRPITGNIAACGQSAGDGCGICHFKDGTSASPRGSGILICQSAASVIDFNLVLNNNQFGSYDSTSIFLVKEGVGYTNIEVFYNAEVQSNTYILCCAADREESISYNKQGFVSHKRQYTDYDEWLKACYAINGFHETILNNFLVHPNPASNGNFTVSFELEKSCNMKIALYDLGGQELLQVYDGFTNSGFFNRVIHTSNLSSGVYFLKILLDDDYLVEKIIVE